MPRREENLRLCVAHGVTGSLELDDEQRQGVYSNGPKYTGSLAEAVNMYLKLFFGSNYFNYTAVQGLPPTSYNSTTGYWDEESCYYQMQINQSDYALGWTTYPLSGKNLEQHPIYINDVMYMLSRYVTCESTTPADFMQSFVDIFSWHVWLFMLLYCATFWAIVKLHVKYISEPGTRDDSLYEVLTHLFQVETIDYQGIGVGILSLCVTLLSFWFFAHFTNLMKTNIIVVKEPNIINTYDDVLALPHAKIRFLNLGGPHVKFEFADPATKEYKIWRKSFTDFGGKKDEMMFRVSGSNMIRVMEELEKSIIDTKLVTVLFISSLFQRVIRKSTCVLKAFILMHSSYLTMGANYDGLNNFYSWGAKDPDAKEFILTWAYSSYYKGPFKSEIHKRVHWAINLGLHQMYLNSMSHYFVPGVKIEDQKQGDIFRSCLADNYHENLPDIPFAPFSLNQYKKLFTFYGSMTLLTLICLVFEKIRQKYKRGKILRQIGRRSRVAPQMMRSQLARTRGQIRPHTTFY